METPHTPLSAFDRLLLRIDEAPVGALIRIAVGYAVLPSWHVVAGAAADGRILIWFLAVLVTMRALPAVLRKIVPFPPGVQVVWAERRQLAKQSDSYQWRKLLWIGVGMSAYWPRLETPEPWATGLAVAVVAAGAIGESVWRARKAQSLSRAG